MRTSLISVVIPTLNEESRIERVLSELLADATAPFETIISDGGSTDATVSTARRLGAVVISGRPGRGLQLSAGGTEAAGDVIWFLHADSSIAPGSLAAIREAIDRDGRTGGNFRLVFDGTDRFSNWLTGFYAWFRRRGLYYGDSGIFLRRDIHDRIGGIRPIALMEDYDLSRRMEQIGGTCCISNPALVTSSRKFRNRHPMAIVFGWLRLHALYRFGVAPDKLARLYYGR